MKTYPLPIPLKKDKINPGDNSSKITLKEKREFDSFIENLKKQSEEKLMNICIEKQYPLKDWENMTLGMNLVIDELKKETARIKRSFKMDDLYSEVIKEIKDLIKNQNFKKEVVEDVNHRLSSCTTVEYAKQQLRYLNNILDSRKEQV